MEIKIRSLWLVIGILLFIAGGIPGLMAQTSSVTVEFFVQPFPSPYLSDWQTNPSIATLTVVNNTIGPQEVIITLLVKTSDGRQVISGSSSPTVLLHGPNVLNNTSLLHGNLKYYDSGIKNQIIQTGRIPEGTYSACVSIASINGVSLVSNDCRDFTIVYPDPPQLVYPLDGDSVNTNYPILQWTPVQVPIQYRVHYVMTMVQLLPGQIPSQALAADVPQYTNGNLTNTALQYPISALPLVAGDTYVWQVQALDQNGFSPASNNGKSQIWTFTYRRSSLILHVPPPAPASPPFRYTFMTTSTVTGSLYGTFSQPATRMTISNKTALNGTWPVANTTVELVAKYMLEQNGSGNQLYKLGESTVELPVPRNSLPADHKYDDADQAVSTTVTDPSGNFLFSFLQSDSTGLIAKDQTINFAQYEGQSNTQTGDLYKVYRIVVQSQYYLSPATDIMVQPYQFDDVGSLPAMAREYSLKIRVLPSSLDAAQQITQGPLVGATVYILRQARPSGVPGSEGNPAPPSSQTIQGMQVVAESQTDNNGQATFSDLVQNIGPNDQYFIYATTSPQSGLSYFCFANSFQFSYSMGFGQTSQAFQIQVNPNTFYSTPATFNNEYTVPTVSTTLMMMPMLPEVAGNVVRKDNPSVHVGSAQVQLLKFALFTWVTESSQQTLSDGSFEFDNLSPTYDNNGDLTGPMRGLDIDKYGFKDTTLAVNNGSPLKLGQSFAPNAPIQLAPAADVMGKVVDEQGNPVEAKVTIGDGSSVTANQPQFKGIVLGGSGSGSYIMNYNTGFQSPAVLGSQQIVIDPTPYNSGATFFIDTEYVNITQDGQDLGTFVVKKRLHRIMIAVSTSGREMIGGTEVPAGRLTVQTVQIPITGAHVAIQSSGKSFGQFLTNNEGSADTMFVSSNDAFTITVTAPDNQDYDGQAISANIPETKDWTIIYVTLNKASHVSGKVFAGKSPIDSAHVFLVQSQSPNSPVVETYTDNNGQYVLHSLPIGASLTIDAAKSQSNYIGDSRKITLSASGNDTLNFNLKVYNGMNITHLMGFPIEVLSLTQSGNNVAISGNFTSLPSNKVFSPQDSTMKIPFHNISIVPGSQKDSNNIPYATPKTLPLTTDANSIQLKIYGTMVGAQTDNDAGIGITDAGNGVGEFSDLTYIDAASFTADPAFSNVKFPHDQLYLGLPGELSPPTKLLIPVIVASGVTPSLIQNGLQISDSKGHSMDYTLYGFDAVADSSASIADGDTVRLQTTIHSNLINVSNPDIDFDIGDVVLHGEKFDPIQGRDTLTIAIEKWQLEGTQWSISQSGGFMINAGQFSHRDG